ncbi:retrovirus-related pol polyprotein from transposon TNT 1-94 [Tanacetum coccineum]
MLQRCEDTNLVLNWEKCHFMVKEGIVLGHKISKSGIEDFSKIARPMTHLLEKETLFIFSKECIEAFETLKMKLTQAPILVAPDWDLPFEIMCDASDFAVGAVLGPDSWNVKVSRAAQLQALVDGKKVIITESTIRRDLQLEDAEGVDCLPNATILEQLTLIGTRESAIICLAINQKFNFSKYIFESMVKNLENVSGKFLMYLRKPKRKNTEVPHPSGSIDNVVDEAVYKELDDSLVRVATNASSLEVEQDSGNINKTRSKATLNEPSPQGTNSGSGPKRQDTMGDTIAQTRFENVSKTSNDSLLAGVITPRSDEDSMKLKELMEFCTKLQQRVLDLENTKTGQAQEITSLKLRVKKLEKKGWSRTHKLKRLYKVYETQGRYGDDLMFDTSDLADEEVFVAEQGVPDSKKDDVVSTAGIATTVSAAATTVLITPEEITLA